MFRMLSNQHYPHRANQKLRSWANAVFQNRGVCGQAVPSFPSPSPVIHFFFALVPAFWTNLARKRLLRRLVHRRYSILEKTRSCNRIKLNYQATKKKIESTRKHRRLGSKFCDRLHHNYVTCSKNKENTLTQLKLTGKRQDSLDDRPPLLSQGLDPALKPAA